MPGTNQVEKISIIPWHGCTWLYSQLPTEDRFLLSETELRGQIATMLGGSAERLSSIALQPVLLMTCRATDLAERMVMTHGMSKVPRSPGLRAAANLIFWGMVPPTNGGPSEETAGSN